MDRLLLILFLGTGFIGLSAQSKLDSLKDVLAVQSGLDEIGTLNELSWEFKNFDLDSALFFANKAYAKSLELNSEEAISQSLNSLANTFEARGEFDSAIVFHNLALEMKRDLVDSLGMASSLNNIGIAYDQLGSFDRSLENYFLALELYEKFSDDPFDIAMVLGNIGIVYKKQKEYEKVLDYYSRALSIYESVGSDFGIYVTTGNISSVFLLTEQYIKAIDYASKAMEGYRLLGYSRYVPYMQHNMAVAHDSLRNFDLAETLYLQSIEGHRKHENNYELVSALVGLSSNQRKLGKYREAINLGRQALELAEELGASEFMASANFELSLNYSALGDYSNAYRYLMIYKNLNDVLFEENKTKQIFELQTRYETEKKEQQIALQEAQISEKEALLNFNKVLLIMALIVIVAIVTIALLNRNRIRKKQQLELQKERLQAREAQINASISSQEQERARYARDLHDGFGQMISILKMHLKSLEGSPNRDERHKVFEESGKVLGEMYDELKSICFDLMPQTLVRNGLTEALDEFALRINHPGKVFVETNFFGMSERLPEVFEVSLYRISQEWINNILKYSNANKVTVQVTRDEEEINLIIEDNGEGFDKSSLLHGSGNGWKNIQSRVNLMRAEIDLDSAPGRQGTTLIINADTRKVKASSTEKNTVARV